MYPRVGQALDGVRCIRMLNGMILLSYKMVSVAGAYVQVLTFDFTELASANSVRDTLRVRLSGERWHRSSNQESTVERPSEMFSLP